MKTFCRAVFLFLGLALPAAARPSGAAPSHHFPPNPNVQVTITCADMRRNPVGVFSRPIDLGTSIFTPTDLDYDCEESLAQRPFLRRLLGLAEQIRGVRQACGVRAFYAMERYYAADLLKAGFVPTLFLQQARAEGRSAGLPEGKLAYFSAWSLRSRTNDQWHAAFLAEYARAEPRLARYYRQRFHLRAAVARAAARQALGVVVDHALGDFASEAPASVPPPLAQLARDPASTTADLRSALAENPAPPQAEIDQALKAALLAGKPRPDLELLIADLSSLDAGDESALSFALGNLENVRLLLERGAAVDYANGFGKTPLFYAIGRGDRALTELLLEHGADVDRPYKSAAELQPPNDEYGPVCGKYPDLQHYGRTPLMHAAQHADIPMLKLLLARGARLEGVDGMGFNALDYARMGHRPANAALLRSLGLRPHQDPAGVPAT
jgi:hypothetical protein